MSAEPLPYDLGPADDDSDAAIARLNLAGNTDGFEILYRRYYPRLVRVCARHVRDDHLAEDLAQETLLRALRCVAGYDTSRPMWPWLKTIATRLCYDHTGRAGREVVVDSL